MHSISKNLKKLRKEKGWTQQQMADYLFVTRQTVSNWENSRAFPDLETIEQIAEKLNVTSEYLLYGKLTDVKYRKLNTFATTLLITASIYISSFVEKIGISVLDRISEYAGYPILQLSPYFSNFFLGFGIVLFSPIVLIILLVNWGIADDNRIFAKTIRALSNILLGITLIFSISSTINSVHYTYLRYENVVVTAHKRFEMAECTPYAQTYYVYYDFGWRGGNKNRIIYIDNDHQPTDDYMNNLIKSQALKIDRVPMESADWFIEKHHINTFPAVIIVTNGNGEVLEGYEEITARLENKIHNYKMHNIFFCE